MNYLRKNLKFIVIFAVLFISLLIGTFFDLEISRAISEVEPGKYYSTNVFAVFFECFGEMPVYILPSIALGILFFYLKKLSPMKKTPKIILMTGFVICAVALNFYGSHKLLKYYGIHVSVIKMSDLLKRLCEVSMGVIFTAVWFFIASLVKEKYLKSLAICSLIVVFTAFLSQVLVQVIKPLFGRARYRLMNITGDFSEFTRWYEINIGKKVTLSQIAMGAESDGYKSFPSGHTAAAGIVLSLMSIPAVLNIGKRRSGLITAATLIFVFIVAYSRILMGAHYLTDVTMGAIITLASYVLSQFVILKVLKKKGIVKANN